MAEGSGLLNLGSLLGSSALESTLRTGYTRHRAEGDRWHTVARGIRFWRFTLLPPWQLSVV